MTLSSIREGDVSIAIQKDDLDEACAYLQGVAGITTGDIAAQVFVALTGRALA
jgi:hypothetical protein